MTPNRAPNLRNVFLILSVFALAVYVIIFSTGTMLKGVQVLVRNISSDVRSNQIQNTDFTGTLDFKEKSLSSDLPNETSLTSDVKDKTALTKEKTTLTSDSKNKVTLTSDSKNKATLTSSKNQATLISDSKEIVTLISDSKNKGSVGNCTQLGERYLIYSCENKRGITCSGWADRQRGLVNTFILSIVTCRRFGVIMTQPCDITQFFVPNAVNWTIPNALLRNKSSIFLNKSRKLNLEKRLREIDFNAEYPQEVIYHLTNDGSYWMSLKDNPRYKHLLPAWAKGPRPVVFRTGWNLLMKPTDLMQESVDSFLELATEVQGGQSEGIKALEERNAGEVKGKRGNRTFKETEMAKSKLKKRNLVCCHVRMGKSETIPNDPVRVRLSELPALWSFLQPYVNNGSRIFFATDSYLVRNISRQLFGNNITDTDGPILHVQRHQGRSNACQGFQAALLDYLILTKCEVFVSSYGGFSRQAAYLRGRHDDLFYFHGGKVTKYWLS